MTSQETYSIKTTDGPIRGAIERTKEGVYYKFKRIPYAKPPLGPLRFRPPCPILPWKEEIDCTQDAPLPLSFGIGKELCGSEDCLYIEVTTKNITPDKPLPVMFWIGSYIYSSTIDCVLDSSYLNDHDVLFVRCGFRLGPLGFLSINEFSAPGNCGLKDLVMALKWVQKHIDKFGGDPNNVTIFGSSTGGSAVHLLLLSTMASGLFHKAIIQSASALNNWSIANNPTQRVIELSAKLGITNKHKIEAVEELRSIPAEDIMQAFGEMHQEKYDADTYTDTDLFDSAFKPCIEEEFEGLPAFLTKSPILIIKSGNFNKVPLMIGSNNIEGSILQHIKKDFYSDFEKYNKNARLLVPKPLSCQDINISDTIGHQLLTFYLGEEEKLTENTRAQYIQMISDYYFLYFINKTVRLHSEFAPECAIYYYIYNYTGGYRIPESLAFLDSHSTELLFIFKIITLDTQVCEASREFLTSRSRFIKMWTNFAKYGNPTPDDDDPLLQVKWDPVESKDKLNYFSIGSELTKGRNPFKERMQFWDELHSRYSLLRMLVYFNDLGVAW